MQWGLCGCKKHATGNEGENPKRHLSKFRREMLQKKKNELDHLRQKKPDERRHRAYPERRGCAISVTERRLKHRGIVCHNVPCMKTPGDAIGGCTRFHIERGGVKDCV
ncbi:Hypothetical predicted protein [Podarcis lilfordi]|uniref:Uncharacterized protein n=1 Tax=Podarcis lilfordi TaxID=74358 RepID=A0AA35JX57_9SAUR|nr:Hypothetical predicted protein [Podarcis lilfordi]